MQKIGGSSRVREELTHALADGRGVTAKVRWISKADEDGRNRWIHCTPLLGSNGQIGVWMVVLVDDEIKGQRRYREAPPVTVESREPRRGYFTHEYGDMATGPSAAPTAQYRQPASSVNTYHDYADPLAGPRGSNSVESVNLE